MQESLIATGPNAFTPPEHVLDSSLGTTSKQDDDEWDIDSFRDSAYGTQSVTSEAPALSHTSEARDCLLNALLADEQLKVLLSAIPKEIGSEKFERSFKTMIYRMAQDLLQEAKDEGERGTAYVASISAGYFAYQVSFLFIDHQNTRAAEMNRLRDQLPQKREFLERVLNTTDQMRSTEKMDIEGETEADNSPDTVPALPQLARLEDFFTKSQALENLRENLRGWLDNAKPSQSTKRPDSKCEEFVGVLDRPVHPTHSLLNSVKKFLRPKVPPMYRRLEWICVC